MKGDGRIAGREVLDISCSHPVGDEIALVDDKDDLLVRLLFTDELEDTLTERAHGVPRIQNVENNV